jgi:hypothetical protein
MVREGVDVAELENTFGVAKADNSSPARSTCHSMGVSSSLSSCPPFFTPFDSMEFLDDEGADEVRLIKLDRLPRLADTASRIATSKIMLHLLSNLIIFGPRLKKMTGPLARMALRGTRM